VGGEFIYFFNLAFGKFKGNFAENFSKIIRLKKLQIRKNNQYKEKKENFFFLSKIQKRKKKIFFRLKKNKVFS